MPSPVLVLFEPETLCLATNKNGTPCKKKVTVTDRTSATRLIHSSRTSASNSIDATGLDGRIISLLSCGLHRESSPSQELLLQYSVKFTQWALENKPLVDWNLQKSKAGSRTCTSEKLLRPIKDTESTTGTVYVFTCADLPDVVKIGYVKGTMSVAKRVTKWRKCYSNPQSVFEHITRFPHRLEELVHCELSSKRHDVACLVAACPSGYHNEWFKDDIAGVVDVVKQWVMLMEGHNLYNASSLQLAPAWKVKIEALAEAEVEITANKLLDTLKVDRLAVALADSSLENSLPENEITKSSGLPQC